ncbi:sulfotransferase domain-containing protein [Candidatus Pelagibacter sp.]|nr:sulfotransferase domain-containing protein [Candidatus Pelagibacter sp.]
MIFWISSYPKSGNTWLRFLIASYYYTKDGFFDENVLKYIDQFPQKIFFKGFNYDSKTPTGTTKFWIKAQEKINQNKKIKFFKTHNIFGSVNNFHFTNRENSIGCVYIVRDPRNVITSLKNFYEMNDNKAFKFITSKNQYIYDIHKFAENGYSDFQFISSWEINYESWKFQKTIPVKIIRYEDLLNQTYSVANEVISFINQITGNKEKISKNKIVNAVSSTSFSKLKGKEEKEGFSEAPKSRVNDSKIPFFNLGPKNKWKTILNDDLKNKLNEVFKKKLEELDYELT